MKVMSAESLPKLPDNVKELVLDGVYGLFSVDHGKEEYAVVIGKESTAYLLGHEGEVRTIVQGADYSNLELREPVTFSRVNRGFARINAM
ncbi:hypothetical protein ACOQNP_26155 [Ectopseudomonas khazarica]|uniref:hypothetical protein n=1 Tax=Ectopseudomonas khazarica TaxID=2502979 RepID=UPI0012DD4967